MKLARLVDPKFQTSLSKLLKQDVPLTVAFRLKGIVKTVQEEMTKYEEVRKEALQKYGNKDESGNLLTDEQGNVKFEQENMLKFAAEINELVNMEVNIPVIKVSELTNVNVSMEDIVALEGLITES